jgi:hypothetical protein
VGPSNKTEPLSSMKAEPLVPRRHGRGVRRARVTQLGAPVKIAESGLAGSSGLMRRAAELPGGSFGNRERGVRGRDHRRNVRRRCRGSCQDGPSARSKAPECGAARTKGPGPGDQDLRPRDRPLDASGDGRTGRGWAGHPEALTPLAHGPRRAGTGRCSGAASGAGCALVFYALGPLNIMLPPRHGVALGAPSGIKPAPGNAHML